MKKTLLTSLGAIMLTVGANAATPYAALKLGHNIVDSDTTISGHNHTNDDIRGFIAGGAGGVSFEVSDMLAIRTELEYNYAWSKGRLSSGANKSTLTDHKIFANAYVDFGGGKWAGFTPYAGLGLAYAIGNLDNGHDINVDGFGLGLYLGTAYAITEDLSLDLGFRWLSMSRKFDNTYAGKGDFDTDELTMSFGVRYAF